MNSSQIANLFLYSMHFVYCSLNEQCGLSLSNAFQIMLRKKILDPSHKMANRRSYSWGPELAKEFPEPVVSQTR